VGAKGAGAEEIIGEETGDKDVLEIELFALTAGEFDPEFEGYSAEQAKRRRLRRTIVIIRVPIIILLRYFTPISPKKFSSDCAVPCYKSGLV
jgi:hypothetical protein